MEITVRKIGAELVFTLRPNSDKDADFINDFGRIGEGFVSEIKKDASCKYPHIELRKDIL